MEEALTDNIRDLDRQLKTIEHMIYVSCKFTKTSEMLRRVMESLVQGYELFFSAAQETFFQQNQKTTNLQEKIQILTENFVQRGIYVNLSEYFLLKRLLLSDFESVGEYRKNLCLLIYLDGEEYGITISKLLDFYQSLKNVYTIFLPPEY